MAKRCCALLSPYMLPTPGKSPQALRSRVFLTPTDLGEVQNINPRVCPKDCRSYVKTTCACIIYANVCIHVDMARYCNGLYGVMSREYLPSCLFSDPPKPCKKIAKNDGGLQSGTHVQRGVGHFCRYLVLFGHLAAKNDVWLQSGSAFPMHGGPPRFPGLPWALLGFPQRTMHCAIVKCYILFCSLLYGTT
jgi:hypothetical protein